MHFLFCIGFVILPEALILSHEKSETFPRAFMVAKMFLFEKLIVAYLVENFSRLIKKNTKYGILFSSLEEVRVYLLGLRHSMYEYSILRMMDEWMWFSNGMTLERANRTVSHAKKSVYIFTNFITALGAKSVQRCNKW